MIDYADYLSETSSNPYPPTIQNQSKSADQNSFKQSILASKDLKDKIQKLSQHIRQIDHFQQTETERNTKLKNLTFELEKLENLIFSFFKKFQK